MNEQRDEFCTLEFLEESGPCTYMHGSVTGLEEVPGLKLRKEAL